MEKAFSMFFKKDLFLRPESQIEPEQFTHIFDSYYQRLYNYIRYRIGNSHESEEVTSQVFEKIYRKISTFQPERGSLEVWLFAIAHHAVNDYHRQKKHRAWFSLESIRELISRQPGPEETALKNEDHHRLLAALDSLGSRERNIIAMKFAGGLKNREIAELTGLSESNVGVILYRSLQQLRNLLEGKE